jgi:hypothetical protein
MPYFVSGLDAANLELAQASGIENRELVRPSRRGYCQR